MLDKPNIDDTPKGLKGTFVSNQNDDAVQSASSAIESGHPESDQRAYRRALAQFATGVAIVTTKIKNQPVGMAINSFTSISLDPPLVAWSIRQESKSRRHFMDAGHFAISVLSQDQFDICRVFAAQDAGKFDKVACVQGKGGAPLVPGAIAHFECSVDQVIEGGDHLVFLGRVDHYARFLGTPLLFAQGQYSGLLPFVENGSTIGERLPRQNAERTWIDLLSSSVAHVASTFESDLHSRGRTVSEARSLRALSKEPLSKEGLEWETSLGSHAVEDALTRLIEMGYVAPGDNDYHLTPLGLEARLRIAHEAEEFTRLKLAGLSQDDLAGARRVLVALSGPGT